MESPVMPMTTSMSDVRAPRPVGLKRLSGVTVIVALLVALLAGPAAARVRTDVQNPLLPPDAKQSVKDTLALAPAQPPSPDDPFVDVAVADLEARRRGLDRITAQAESETARRDANAATNRRDVALFKEVEAKSKREEASRKLSRERKRLSDITVRAFVTGGTVDVDRYRSLLNGDTSDPETGRQIVFSQVVERQKQVTENARASLRAAKERLADADDYLKLTQGEADARAADAADADQRLIEAVDTYNAAVAAAGQARDDLKAAARRSVPLVPLGVSIIGMPRLTPEDLAGWFATTSYRPLVATPIADYARWFIEEGQAEGIRGDIAFAQAVLETGGFTNGDSVFLNNFSGIGHCDLCPSGWTFASPQIGVRGQIQLLKSYAVAKPEYANPLAHDNLHGPAGCCATWGDLTTVWATDPGYGPKVMLIYTDMVSYALQRRAAG